MSDTRETGDVLVAWVMRRQAVPPGLPQPAHGLRFAFLGRMSTNGFQDYHTSHGWQHDIATALIARHGSIVTEYFDICPRTVAWPDRQQASRLLQAIASPAREFDALVVGEYERAFCGQQLQQLEPLLRKHGIGLWLPETGGPVDFTNPRQLAMLDALGVKSHREIIRARIRTTRAMHHQAADGRHLGGRPPYGYQIVDAGAHPNTVHARWGRTLKRLEPDPRTAPTVRWIFQQRLTRQSIASITLLTQRPPHSVPIQCGPCP